MKKRGPMLRSPLRDSAPGRRPGLLAVAAAEVAVSVAVVDLGYIGEELGVAHPFEREGGLHARVGVSPLAGQFNGRMGSVHHDVVGLSDGCLAFALDPDEGLDEAVHLLLGLRLRGLDHQRLVHGERERRGVEAVVHQTVGDVAAVDVVLLLEVRQVEDHLVAHAARLARVVGAVLRGQRRRHVVGVASGA